MNMKQLLVVLFFCTITNSFSQTVTSSCSAHDSILYKMGIQASRLSLRHEYAFNDTYKDSIQINPQLLKRYRDALVAVYNATTFAVHDSIFDTLKVRTNPVPEMNNMNVKASPSLAWMVQLYNNQAPSSSSVISGLMARYNMIYTYLQATGYDVILFHTDTCLNLPAMANLYNSQGALSATPETGYDDTRNITDSLNPNFIILNYSYGWGTCQNGCDYRLTWSFKVYLDCTVEYLGETGVVPNLSGLNTLNKVMAWPSLVNPSTDFLQFLKVNAHLDVEIFSVAGQLLKSAEINPQSSVCGIENLNTGLYFLKMKYQGQEHITRFVKQ